MNTKPCLSEEQWELVGPYLALIKHGASQRKHYLSEVVNALR